MFNAGEGSSPEPNAVPSCAAETKFVVSYSTAISEFAYSHVELWPVTLPLGLCGGVAGLLGVAVGAYVGVVSPVAGVVYGPQELTPELGMIFPFYNTR